MYDKFEQLVADSEFQGELRKMNPDGGEVMGSKTSMYWTDWRGNEVTRDVNQVINVRDFVGTPGYALLLVAANTNLSVGDILRYFGCDGVGRSRSWIQRRRWLFQQPDTNNGTGP